MLDSIKTCIKELPDIPFEIYYQDYICRVQDMNIQSEISGIKLDEIVTIERLIQRLNSISIK